MTEPIDAMALFRLTVLGPLASRDTLVAGELSKLLQELAGRSYQLPNGQSKRFSAKTIERWYYRWRRSGIEALNPSQRKDCGQSHIPTAIQQALLDAKQNQPSRSINRLIQLLETQGAIGRGQLSRSSVHRLLVRHRCSKRTVADAVTIERRSFEAQHPGDIWYGDVMHGPRVDTANGQQKTYLVSFMDDCSRLICHSAFYFSESAISVEHALKEALLKRGLPKKLVVDNGSAYRSGSLQQICARLNIRLVYCRPYEPEGKGKLERWHRTLRDAFLTELSETCLQRVDELNARLWVWIEKSYHQQPHSGLNQTPPLQRWRDGQAFIRPLGDIAKSLDSYFYHRIKRTVRKDGTLSFNGKRYEVPYELSGQSLYLVVEPYQATPQWVESLEYQRLGSVCEWDKLANCHRPRQRPEPIPDNKTPDKKSDSLVEALYERTQEAIAIAFPNNDKE